MKNVTGFICLLLLTVTTSDGLPSDKPIKKPVRKGAEMAVPATKPAVAPKLILPEFHWFGPIKKNDKC